MWQLLVQGAWPRGIRRMGYKLRLIIVTFQTYWSDPFLRLWTRISWCSSHARLYWDGAKMLWHVHRPGLRSKCLKGFSDEWFELKGTYWFTCLHAFPISANWSGGSLTITRRTFWKFSSALTRFVHVSKGWGGVSYDVKLSVSSQ